MAWQPSSTGRRWAGNRCPWGQRVPGHRSLDWPAVSQQLSGQGPSGGGLAPVLHREAVDQEPLSLGTTVARAPLPGPAPAAALLLQRPLHFCTEASGQERQGAHRIGSGGTRGGGGVGGRACGGGRSPPLSRRTADRPGPAVKDAAGAAQRAPQAILEGGCRSATRAAAPASRAVKRVSQSQHRIQKLRGSAVDGLTPQPPRDAASRGPVPAPDPEASRLRRRTPSHLSHRQPPSARASSHTPGQDSSVASSRASSPSSRAWST